MALMQQEEQYEGTVVQVGNLRGMRLPAGFFYTHLKLEGEGMVTVVADGANLVSAKSVAKQKSKDVVEVVEPDGLFCATVRKVRMQALSCHLARNVVVVVGVGTTPNVPSGLGFSLNERDFGYSARYGFIKKHLMEKSSITVVGSVHSAAECFLDPRSDQNQQGYKLNWLNRSNGFFLVEYSRLGLEHFSLDYPSTSSPSQGPRAKRCWTPSETVTKAYRSAPSPRCTTAHSRAALTVTLPRTSCNREENSSKPSAAEQAGHYLFVISNSKSHFGCARTPLYQAGNIGMRSHSVWPD